MKLLFIHNTIPEYRIPFFKKLSQKVDVDYVFTDISLNKKIYNNDINFTDIEDLNIKYLPNGSRHYFELIKIIMNKDYTHIIIPPMDSLKEYLHAVFSFCIAKLKGKKILYFWEKWEAPYNRLPIKKKIKNKLQRIMCKPIIKNVDICIASGTKSKEYFMSYNIKSQNIVIAYDACEVEYNKFIDNIRLEKNIPENDKIILYYGRIVERKGLDILIKAFDVVQNKKRTGLHLIICGDGEFKNKCEKIVEINDIKNVYFEGHIHPKNRDKYFSQCDIFVIPSYFWKGIPEAWGLTVNEAMQFKKAIIATTAVGSSYDIIDEGNNGMIIEEGNQFELENALLYYINNYDKEKISISNEKIFKKINYETMSDSFIEAILLSN